MLDGSEIAGLDLLTGTFALPVWAAATLAAFFVVACVLVLTRAGGVGPLAAGLRIAAVLIGVVLAIGLLDRSASRDRNNERRALDARAAELATRVLVPGSPLACLDGVAGDVVESACEQALFANPQTVAAATSYIAARLALLTDAAAFARRPDTGYGTTLPRLRRAIEADPFGVVAHVLSIGGCNVTRCEPLSLLQDTTRVSFNLKERVFERYVAKHAPSWTADPGAPPVAMTAAPAIAAAEPAGGPADGAEAAPHPTGHVKYEYPSAASIPPISIMDPEPPRTSEKGNAAAKPAEQAGKPEPAQPARRAVAPPRSLAPPSVGPTLATPGGGSPPVANAAGPQRVP